MAQKFNRSPARSLADDTFMKPGLFSGNLDPDIELFTYPDCIDQRQIGSAATAFCGIFAHDDMEIDDGV